MKACVMEMFTLVPPLKPGKRGDAGIVPEGSIVRDVVAKRVVVLGGLSALLLQVAHPMIAQGVSDYSHFEHDPLARLMATLDATLVMTSGDTDQVAGKAYAVRRAATERRRQHGLSVPRARVMLTGEGSVSVRGRAGAHRGSCPYRCLLSRCAKSAVRMGMAEPGKGTVTAGSRA